MLSCYVCPNMYVLPWFDSFVNYHCRSMYVLHWFEYFMMGGIACMSCHVCPALINQFGKVDCRAMYVVRWVDFFFWREDGKCVDTCMYSHVCRDMYVLWYTSCVVFIYIDICFVYCISTVHGLTKIEEWSKSKWAWLINHHHITDCKKVFCLSGSNWTFVWFLISLIWMTSYHASLSMSRRWFCDSTLFPKKCLFLSHDRPRKHPRW